MCHFWWKKWKLSPNRFDWMENGFRSLKCECKLGLSEVRKTWRLGLDNFLRQEKHGPMEFEDLIERSNNKSIKSISDFGFDCGFSKSSWKKRTSSTLIDSNVLFASHSFVVHQNVECQNEVISVKWWWRTLIDDFYNGRIEQDQDQRAISLSSKRYCSLIQIKLFNNCVVAWAPGTEPHFHFSLLLFPRINAKGA